MPAKKANQNEPPRVQITLDPWVAMMLSGIEKRKLYGETKKEVANDILREWLRNFMKQENIKPEDARRWSEEFIS